MKVKYVLLGAVALLLGWLVYDSLSQASPQDLPGNFQEVAAYRNENNTGPIVRVYAVTVADTLWRAMRQYGDLMPYTKYGRTEVYFFRAGQPAPGTVQPGKPSFDTTFERYCLARYEKDAMSKATLQPYPFREQ